MRSGSGNQKGIVSLTVVLALGGVLVFFFVMMSFFSGGSVSGSVLGWQGTPLLEGIDTFITGVYNNLIWVSQWVAIGVLGLGLVGIQIAFIFLYYKIVTYLMQFQPTAERFLRQLTDF